MELIEPTYIRDHGKKRRHLTIPVVKNSNFVRQISSYT